jgi:hypothetical protein
MDDVLKKIGKVCAQFQYIEQQISLSTMCMINKQQEIGQAVVSVLPFSRLCDVFLALVRTVSSNDEFNKKCESLIKEASEMEQLRNQIVHSSVVEDGQGNIGRFKTKVNRKRGVVSDLDSKYPETLDDIITKMGSLTQSLKELQKKGQELDIFTKPYDYV